MDSNEGINLDDAPAPLGCGALSREALLHIVSSRLDYRVRVDERSLAHVLLCAQCTKTVNHLVSIGGPRRELSGPLANKTANTMANTTANTTPPSSPTSSPTSSSPVAPDPLLIPGYLLGKELHRGGQGAVFAAEQLVTRRPCAVKMLLGGRFASATQRIRFEREVEVVAALRHPSIVTLYESGITTEGEPWFAMEFVAGERLDEYVKRVHLGPREIADLIRRIAQAIAYAHRRGVIHRDLKPGNILIDKEGSPRVLDFGLARSAMDTISLDHRSTSTKDGEFIGTFTYAAPEQLAGDPSGIDSRCDLYTLGMVFYECLVGALPFESARSLVELVEQKSVGAVRRPSEVAPSGGPRIDRDIDVIVLRLLSVEPARRYDTADALVEDLERYADGRPILAREDSLNYVLAKTVRRHWIVSSLILVILLTVVVGGILLGLAYRRAEAERTRVDRAYKTFREALESADPELGVGSSEMKVTEFLTLVESQVRAELMSEPELMAEILQTLGVIQLGFDDSSRGRDAILRSYEIIKKSREQGRVSEAQFATATVALAKLRFSEEDFTGAEASYRQALEIRQRTAGVFAVETVDTERQLASALRAQKRYVEAQQRLDEALEHADNFLDGKASAIVRAGIRNGMGVLALAQNDGARAIDEFKAALDAISGFIAEDDFRIGRTLYSMARAEFQVGRLNDAAEHARKAYEILRLRKGETARSAQAALDLLNQIDKAR